MGSPIELENYSAKCIMVTVTDPKAKLEFYKTLTAQRKTLNTQQRNTHF